MYYAGYVQIRSFSRFTTSNGCKYFSIDNMEVNDLEILLIDVTFGL